MKRHRGLKRYYRNLSIQNDFDNMDWLDFSKPDTWFDNWHIHFDWQGYGNYSMKKRKPHLDKLFRHFDLLIERTKELKLEFQLYSIILDFDSYSDSLALHTPNPNNTQFPFKIESLQSVSTLKNEQLNDYIANLKGYEKLYGQADEAFCLLFKKGVGIGFE